MEMILILSISSSLFLLRALCVSARGIPDEPNAWFDALRDQPEWGETERDEAFDQLLRRFTADQLLEAARERLGALDGEDGEAVLRIIEAFGAPDDFEALAQAIAEQPDLSAERTWEALSLLEGSGLIESLPALADRWEELVDLVEGDDPIATLAEQIEEPGGVWVALQGLGGVEPDLRAAIIAGLAKAPTRPYLVDFLRYLTFTTHLATRQSALEALEAHERGSPELIEAWTTIANRHPDESVAARARRWLAQNGKAETRSGLPQKLPVPRILKSLVTSVDGRGRAQIALVAEDRGQMTAVVFVCEVEGGIRDTLGEVAFSREAAEELIDVFVDAGFSGQLIEVEPSLALAMLAGSWMLSGPEAPPALPFWIERTAGPLFRPKPLLAWVDEEIPTVLSPVETEFCARLVLDACPSWIDDSALTFDLAEEAMLQGSPDIPEPGVTRFLFERRLRDRLEGYRRMLLWMALLWRAEGSLELSRSALALTHQLSDPQHAVPGHPFLTALAQRSLQVARGSLRAGRDPRRKAATDPESPGYSELH